MRLLATRLTAIASAARRATSPPDPHPGDNLLLEINDLLLLEDGTDALLLEP